MTEAIYRPVDEGKRVQALFQANVDALKKSAPRAGGDAGRLIRIAFNSIVYDEKLRKCTQESLMGGVMEALKLGLTLGGPMQEAWLIPFRDNKKNAMVATFIVGYQGYRNIIDRGRSVLDLHPSAVYAGDEFEFYRTEDGPKLRHVPYYMLGKEKGQLTHVYAVARLRGGGRQVEVLTLKDINAHRNRSRAKDSGPWVSDFDAMALKTSIRVIAKYLPKSSELLARALDLDDRADRGVDQDFDVTDIKVVEGLPTEAATTKQTGALDGLKEALKGNVSPITPELRPDPAMSEEQENAALDAEIARRDTER